MAKKKKRTALPRVTVLAYSRRDLAAFVGAVEKLGILVDDLQQVANTITKKKKPTSPPPPPPPAGGAP